MYTELLLTAQLFFANGNLNKIPASKPQTVVAITLKQKTITSKGDFRELLEAIGVRETGLPTGNPKQYQFINPQLGFLGKYQFAEVLLKRLGYYKPKGIFYGGGADKNYWRGTWTGKRGINSKEKFLNSPDAQEVAIREAFSVYFQDINNILKKQKKSLNNYLGKKITFNDRGKSKTVTITLSGVLAGAHLKGPDSLAELLVKGKVSSDPFGTSIVEYVEEFGGYNTQIKDFFVPGI
ncbi:MAG: hypothetical protein KME64_12560 [Scytonematopsis contorta HA4267-MV1]|jgi:hypothetical protein|nr:hypothetical protein [Scytonematopsis contorta HA4267-MV1]